MSYDYEPRERDRERSRRHAREDAREPRYADDSYLRPYPSNELVPRRREESELSVEEIHRDFPPPGYHRSRSAEPGYYDDYRDDYRRDYDRYERDSDRRSKKTSSSYYYEEEQKRSRKRVLKNQEKIFAALAGAALAFGGKELYDRYDARENGTSVERNYLHSAALGAAGALAGYQGAEFYNKHAQKEEKTTQLIAHRGRDGYEEGEEEKKGSKSFLEGALAASGLGAAVKALTGGDNKDKDDKDGNNRDKSRSRSAAPGAENKNDGAQKVQKAAMASLIAGATEAFRVAREPGSWKGEKTKRIFTAAAGAAAVDSAQDREQGSKLGLAESVIGGLVSNRVINGSKKNIEMDEKTGRSRSRSRARSKAGESSGGGNTVSGLAALATAGLGALGAKKVYDSHKDKKDEESRGRSADSYDSRDDDRRDRQRSRSRSVVDSARKRLARIGIGSDPTEKDKDKDSRRDDSEYDDSRGSRRGHRRYSDEYSDDDRGYQRSRDPRDRDGYDDDRSQVSHRRRDRSRRRSRSSAASESDLGDSDDDLKESRRKRDDRRRY